jgi:aryl-alcohol dehydrogenase-like predicted oxidoreductase
MQPYVDAGFTTFDMADHYGDAEEIVGKFHTLPGAKPTQLLTKWVPKPGSLTEADVREAINLSRKRMCGARFSTARNLHWRSATSHCST